MKTMANEGLRQAITAVQAGEREAAEEILLGLVQQNPHNEMAWLWLSDVLENFDDRIIALENAIAINPKRVQTRKRLAQIRQSTPVSKNGNQPGSILLEDGQRQEMFRNLIQQVRHAPQDASAWFALSQLVDGVADQIAILERTLHFNPHHHQARKRFTQLHLAFPDVLALGKAFQAQNDLPRAVKAYRFAVQHAPSSTDEAIAQKRLRQVRQLLRHYGHLAKFTPPAEPARNFALAQGRKAEEEENWMEAIAAYSLAKQSAATAVTRSTAQTRLETAVRQQSLPTIKLASATTTLWRLGIGPVLLYTLLLLLHGGLNPFRLPFPLLAGGISVLIGSLTLVAVMITPHHILTQRLLGVDGRVDQITRMLLNILGILLILFPFLLLLIDAMERLAAFSPTIPRFF